MSKSKRHQKSIISLFSFWDIFAHASKDTSIKSKLRCQLANYNTMQFIAKFFWSQKIFTQELVLVGDIRGCVSDVPGAEQRVVPQTGGQEHWGVLLIIPVSAALSNTHLTPGSSAGGPPHSADRDQRRGRTGTWDTFVSFIYLFVSIIYYLDIWHLSQSM